ncbi:MAG: flotillin-like FloA family protein [Lentisphaeraceae bacterium]|nr:flotillin-like FloA family protein [Lentisphaeraceae bacterium]
MGALIKILAVVMLPLNFTLFVLARSNAVPVGLTDLALFRLRGISPSIIIDAAIRLHKVGLMVEIEELQRHVMAGGDLPSVTSAAVSVSRSRLKFSFEDLCTIDLAGRDVYEAVESYVNPCVIKCPAVDAPEKSIVGMAKDGIRLAVQVRITVRVDLSTLVGGAGEMTLRARVGEATIHAIGRIDDHKEILKSPDYISKLIQDANIVENTAFELVSVDVLEVEVVDNMGAKLATEQALADKHVAEARAEAKRAEAVATGQEMKARKKGMKAQLVYSKSSLPNAMAEALREGNVGNKTGAVARIREN